MTLIVLLACGAPSGTGGPPSTQGPPSTPAPPSIPVPLERVPPADEPVVGEVPDELMQPVMADAAVRAEVEASQVEVVRAQAVQWSDGSLGCPEPGMFYTQAIIDGYWVEVEAGGERLDYRLDNRGNFRLCNQPIPPGTGSSPSK
ncbi:MAG: hypothetical protein ACRDVM_08725 [Acidimicrobiia bacterium]